MSPADNKPTVTVKQPAEAGANGAKKAFQLDSRHMRLLLIGGLIAMIAVFISVMFLGLSALSGKSDALVNLKAQSQADDTELLNLEQAKKDVEKYSYFKAVAKTVIPNDKDQAEAVSEIFQFAKQAGIRIQNITFPTSSLGLNTSSLGTAAQDATTPAATSKAISQAKPVTGISGLYSLELTISPQNGNDVPPSFQVTYPKVLAFLKSIEDNRRTAQITQVVIQPPSSADQSLSFTLTTNIFIKP